MGALTLKMQQASMLWRAQRKQLSGELRFKKGFVALLSATCDPYLQTLADVNASSAQRAWSGQVLQTWKERIEYIVWTFTNAPDYILPADLRALSERLVTVSHLAVIENQWHIEPGQTMTAPCTLWVQQSPQSKIRALEILPHGPQHFRRFLLEKKAMLLAVFDDKDLVQRSEAARQILRSLQSRYPVTSRAEYFALRALAQQVVDLCDTSTGL